jgi:hypothetical protein
MDVAILRLIHIAAGAFWVGGVYTFFLFVQPTGMALGPGGQPFMHNLLHERRISTALLTAAVITVLAGLWLLWLTTGGLKTDLLFDSSRIGFTIGGIAAILTLAVGGGYVFPRTRIVEGILGAFLGESRPPTDEERQTLMRASGEARRAGYYVLLGLAIAIFCMATARYWGLVL